MSKKCRKMFISFLIFILILFCFSQAIFADWDPNFDTLSNGTAEKSGNMAMDIFGSIINITQLIGMGIAIIVLVVVGIQYVVAAPSEKAEIKNKSINFIIGAVLIFSAAAILQIVKMFVESNVKYD